MLLNGLKKIIQANPTKFLVMFMKRYTSKEISPEFLNVCDIKLPAETEVKLLGMTMDNKLKFDKLCKSAEWQLNVLYIFRGIFVISEKEIMYNKFILSNFNLLSHDGISVVKLNLIKLKIFKTEPYVLCSMIKSVHMNPF